MFKVQYALHRALYRAPIRIHTHTLHALIHCMRSYTPYTPHALMHSYTACTHTLHALIHPMHSYTHTPIRSCTPCTAYTACTHTLHALIRSYAQILILRYHLRLYAHTLIPRYPDPLPYRSTASGANPSLAWTVHPSKHARCCCWRGQYAEGGSS
jgi:hypothetical protein